jgi:hypothetical protein
MKKREKAGSALLAAAALTGLMAGMVFADDTSGAGASTDDSTKTSTKKPAGKHSCKGKKTTKGDAGKSSCKGKSSCSSK